ncbi:methyltransferase domain-containing protein [uncultured Deefgea sp.]|uniref:methyltransferase domain-containing protein n=1 Tax=uncultured Deefgea sp. TaxID=1304914 RepID=UPI0025967895|nr:glycosyltransferase family 2 protein [uncultured Deefgea sp.]
MKKYCLKKDYRSNYLPEYYEDETPLGLVYQPDVYRFAEHLATTSGAEIIIDIGSGNGEKLEPFVKKNFSILCFDIGSNIERLKSRFESIEVFPVDLEMGLPDLPIEILSRAIVICSDVIEHIKEPHCLLLSLSKWSSIAKFVCISTPDRDRARGLDDIGPPLNRAHVREWSLAEFHQLLKKYDFSTNFLGRTVNDNFHMQKSNIFHLDGVETRVSAVSSLKVLAIINVYNELDILPEVLIHLVSQGVDVHVVDNWSSDGSWELASQFAIKSSRVMVSRFPDAPSADYEWSKQLKNVEDVALNSNYDWCIHYDADEIRYSPWHDVNLVEAISFVDSLGYNAIDFTVFNFRFINGQVFKANYQDNMVYMDLSYTAGYERQVKAWRQYKDVKVDLEYEGGHDVQFEGRRVFPLKFLNKHYPLRNPEQAARKIFVDRKPRMLKERQEFGRHQQYDAYTDSNKRIGWDYSSLRCLDIYEFNVDFIVERLSGIGIYS